MGNRDTKLAAGFILAAFLFGCMVGCAPATNRPLLTRGLPADERKHFVVQNGYGIPEEIKRSFLDGFLLPGMSKELVFQLYGAPDRESEVDSTWEYINHKGNLITGVEFKEEKVERIYGDPRGGFVAAEPAQ